MSILTAIKQKIGNFGLGEESEETIKARIISLHKDLRRLRNKIKIEKKIDERKKLQKEITILAEEKKNWEQKLIRLVASEFCYFGVGVNLNDIRKGLEIILIPWADIQNHILNIGTTRVGKTKLMLSNIRQAIQKGDNLIVIDPKGGVDQEILGSLIYFCTDSNRLKDFFYINPALPNISLTFNPLFGMEDDEIASLITTLIYPVTTSENEFYGRYIMSILNQILSALTFLDMVEDMDGVIRKREERKELLNFILKRQKMIMNKEGSVNERTKLAIAKLEQELDQLIQASDKDKTPRVPRSLITLREISLYLSGEQKQALKEQVESVPVTNDDGSINFKLKKKKEEVLQLFSSTDDINIEHHNKIAISLTNWINSFSTGTLGQLFCTTRINPLIQRIYDPKSGIVLLIQPLPLRFKKLSDDINKIIMKMIETSYGLVSLTGRSMGNKRTHMHFDEGESVLYSGIESILNKLAGLGATVYIYTQSYADLDSKLSETISRIAQDSLNTYLIMKVNDPISVDKSIALVGTQTIARANFLQNGDSVSSSYSNETRDILNKEDIIKLDVGEAYLRNRGNIYKVVFPEMTNNLMLKIAIKKQEVEMSYDNLTKVENTVIDLSKNITFDQLTEEEREKLARFSRQ